MENEIEEKEIKKKILNLLENAEEISINAPIDKVYSELENLMEKFKKFYQYGNYTKENQGFRLEMQSKTFHMRYFKHTAKNVIKFYYQWFNGDKGLFQLKLVPIDENTTSIQLSYKFSIKRLKLFSDQISKNPSTYKSASIEYFSAFSVPLMMVLRGFKDELEEKSALLKKIFDIDARIKRENEFWVFISYSLLDSALFNIPLIAEHLKKKPEIDDVFFCEKQLTDDIIFYMNQFVGECDIFLFFASENSLHSKAVNAEWMAALQKNKKIIPVFIDPRYIPTLLSPKLGAKFEPNNLNQSISNIYKIIQMKSELFIENQPQQNLLQIEKKPKKSPSTIFEMIRGLKQLYDDGILTIDEFILKKKELLDRI